MQKFDLLTIGDCSIDLFMKIPDRASVVSQIGDDGISRICFNHGSKIMVESFQTSISGNSINVAMGTNLLGIKTAVYSETGDDDNADKIERRLKTEGIDTKFLVKNQNTETALHAVIVFAGERTIFSYHGKRDYKVHDWDKPKFIYYTSLGEGFETFQKELVDYVNATRSTEYSLKKNSQTGLIFNPGTFQMAKGVEALKNVLSVCDVLIVNKEEAIKLTGNSHDDTINELHEKLKNLGPKLTVITDGDRGSSAFDGKHVVSQEIFKDKRPVVDKTGAGDAFSAGFVAALILGKKLEEALKWGAINSSCQIKVVGSVEGMLTRKELEEKL